MKLLRQLRGYADNKDIKISMFDLWKKVYLDYANKDDSLYPKVETFNYYSDGTSIFSGKNKITKIFTIDSYPRDLPINYRTSIRQESKGGTKISFISVFDKTFIDWSSAQMRSRLRTWRSLSENGDDVDEFNYRESITAMDTTEWRRNSLIYLSDADVRRHRQLFKYRTAIFISGERGRDFDDTVKAVFNYCNKSLGMVISEVTEGVEDYLSYFSPYKQSSATIIKKLSNVTIPDEMASRLSSYDQGKIGNKGQYWGTDVSSGFPVFKGVKNNPVDAENILITAETGGGKSYFLKCLISQITAENNINGTIMDIEGFEYLFFASYVANWDEVVVLNMAEGQGAYYDPVEIVMTGDEVLDKEMFSFSKSFTISILKTCLGKAIATGDWADTIINKAIAKTYSDLGVVQTDNTTWGNSEGSTLFDVYGNIKLLYNEVRTYKQEREKGVFNPEMEYMLDEDYLSTLNKVVAKLSAYFEPFENGGTRSDVFSKRVSLKSIVDAKLVICSFGMAGKSADMVDPIQMSLTQLSAANISYMRSIFSQARGMYNYKVWEEFQRWGDFPDSEKTISTALTGGRKLGDINFIVTNDVKKLLHGDKFSIFGNVTSFAIGAIDDDTTRTELCERLSIPLLKPSLDKLVIKKGNNESFSEESRSDDTARGTYNKAFLIRLDKQVATITKMILPKSVSNSSIFKTGDISTINSYGERKG